MTLSQEFGSDEILAERSSALTQELLQNSAWLNRQDIRSGTTTNKNGKS